MTTRPISPALGDVYDAINNEVVYLHAAWRVYWHIFIGKENVEIMNRLFPFAARTMQDALLDSVLLHITRLCDPANSQGGKCENLTLEQLINDLSLSSALEFKLKDLLDKIRSAGSSFIEHRNKRIAHIDLKHALADNEHLPTFSRNSIDTTLGLIRDFMNTINRELRDSTTVYDNPGLHGGGDSFINAIEMAARFNRIREKAIRKNASPNEVFDEICLPINN